MEINNVDYRNHLPVSDQRIAKIPKGTEEDYTLEILKGIIKTRWFKMNSYIEMEVQVYFTFCEELVVQYIFINMGKRIVVPTAI